MARETHAARRDLHLEVVHAEHGAADAIEEISDGGTRQCGRTRGTIPEHRRVRHLRAGSARGSRKRKKISYRHRPATPGTVQVICWENDTIYSMAGPVI